MLVSVYMCKCACITWAVCALHYECLCVCGGVYICASSGMHVTLIVVGWNLDQSYFHDFFFCSKIWCTLQFISSEFKSKTDICSLSVAAPGGGGGSCPPPPPYGFRCFFSSFFFVFFFFLLVISVGHGHDSTRTPLQNVCGNIFEVGGKKCVGGPPPPPPSLHNAHRALVIVATPMFLGVKESIEAIC